MEKEEVNAGSNSTAVTADEEQTKHTRQSKFRELKARLTESTSRNKEELFAEHRRQQTNHAVVARTERKRADAELELEKLDAMESGQDFERKRAWDWTIEESEKWDERIERKKQAKRDSVFSDYAKAANRVYQRELRELDPDKQAYLKQKTDRLEKSNDARIIEHQGKLVLSEDETQFNRAHRLDFADNKPPKEAVDRLVDSINKSDQQRMRNSRKSKDDGDDIMAINDKNKKFNAKVARYYDKYTKEIRDSFERGTAL
ncbi:SYF2 splicing factor-domain-containing protein [Lipomyces oligophaga]|uniref:SYF2 splicing factor-domain-containing protein n=1 Tax=Lipomyces oligophaga TaxID=45792 RepID=UPI0034CD5A35